MSTILVAEDSDINRTLLVRRMNRAGHEVIEAIDGEQAVVLARKHVPAIILMDLSMPILDGWEATRILRADPQTAAIPIIALTAHAIQEELDRALEAGCDAVVTKPFELADLLGKIATHIARSSDD